MCKRDNPPNIMKLERWLWTLYLDHPVKFWMLAIGLGVAASLPIMALSNWLSRL